MYKKLYVKPEMNIVCFSQKDIITTSNNLEGNNLGLLD